MRTARRRHDLAAGIAAGAGLLVLLTGVPTALVTVIGWPLPRALPRIETVLAALRYGQIAPTTLLQALAVVLWLTWAAIAIGIALEVTAVLRGTVARVLPGLGPLQHLAARLVATVMLVSSVVTRAAADAPPASPVTWPPIEADAGHDGRTVPNAAPSEQRAVGGWWTVQRHDSLWTIAERTLGDGHRWREIATRNVGRPQPDGGRLRRGDTLIRPGWRLELPPDAQVPSGPARVTVAAGDDLWSIAEQRLDDGGRWREIYAHNRGRLQPGGGRLDDPDVIRPGWILDLPTTPRAALDRDAGRGPTRTHRRDDDTDARPRHEAGQTRGDTASDPYDVDATDPSADPGNERSAAPVPTPATPSTMAPAAGTRVTGRGDRGMKPPAPPQRPRLAPTRFESAAVDRSDPGDLARLATAVVAAGLVGLLAHRRRHWLRRRAAGTAPTPVDPEAAELERWLRSMADHDLTHRTDHVLCVLTEHFAAHGVTPEVRAVELGEDVVLHLGTVTDDVPPSVTSIDGGRRWIVGAELEMTSAERDHRYVAALISCGRLASGSLLQLDPMAVGGIGVSGPDDVVADAMTSWTTELASTGAARGVDLVVVGRHHPLVERLARVSIAAGAAAAAERVRRLLDTGERADTGIVVLCGAGVAADDAAVLVDIATHPQVGLVVAGRQDTAAVVELAGDGVHVLPDDLWLDAPEWLTPDDWDRFGDLLQQTDRAHGVASVPPALRRTPAVDDVELEAAIEPPGSAHLVGVLGPLTINDRPPEIDDDTSELLTWLAIHRTGADAAVLHDLLRPGRVPDGPAIDHTVAHLDAVLDTSEPAVVRTDDGRFELRDTVTTDLAHCDTLLRGLDRHPPPVQARRMYAVLELVRGEPFTDCGAWAHADGTALRTAGTIIDIAHRLAMQSLTIGDVERATWAVDRGLLAAPMNELLHRDRMRIADMAGDAAAVDACMHRLRLSVEADGGWLTPETEALYRELRGNGGPDLEQDAS